MLGFGVGVGVVFPFFARYALDTPPATSWWFFAMCIGAGLSVGGVNFLLFNLVVSQEIARLVDGMSHVYDNVSVAVQQTGTCGSQDCLLEVDSDDAIGDLARTFNQMTEAVALRISLESGVRTLLTRVSTTTDPDIISEVILTSMCQAYGASAGMLFGGTGDKFALLATKGVDTSQDAPRELDLDSGPIRQARSGGEPLILEPGKAGLDWVTMSTPLGSFRPQAVIVAPIQQGSVTCGILVLARPEGMPTEGQQELAETLRSHAAIHLQNAIQFQRNATFQQLAAEDELTRLLNRRFGLRRLREEHSRAKRYGDPLTVMVIDIDHFKTVNDTWGHDAGDAVLRRVAMALEDGVRAADVLSRYGGEEFLLVAPRTDRDGAVQLAERLRRTVQAETIPFREQTLKVTASFGIVSTADVQAPQPQDLITAADKALYYAKEIGRNRVAVNRGDRLEAGAELRRQDRQAAA